MSEQLHVDPGHALPDAEWGAVVRRAREVREEIAATAGGGAASGIAPVLDLTAAGVRSKKYFPVSGIPTQLLVLHSAECPLQGGYARSLTEWFQSTVYPAAPVASWQRFVDPLHRVRAVPDELGAWHASEANVNSIGWEQAGYARFSRAEWLTPDGKTQLESLAFDMAEVAVRDGIPARWLTNAEVVAATHGGNRSIKGFCLHRQVDPETRTDPGDGYPYDLLMERIIFYMGGNAPTTTEGNFMPDLTEAEQRRILAAADRINYAISNPSAKVLTTAHVKDMSAQAADAVLNTPIKRAGAGASIGDGKTSLAGMVAYADDHTIQLAAASAARVASDGASVAEIEATLRRVMTEETVKVDVTVNGRPGLEVATDG
jgi:hypothetical protein